jgi:hypothetical protein
MMEDLKQVPRQVNDRLKKHIANHDLGDWIHSGRFGYAVIVSSEKRKALAERALERERKKDEFLAKAKITVHYAPTPPLLSDALKTRARSIS